MSEKKVSKIDKIAEKIQPFITFVTDSKVINSIIGGMLGALPITLIGAFASVFLNLSFLQGFVTSTGIDKVLNIIIQYTTNFISIIYTFAVAYSYAKQYKVEGLVPALMSVVSFLILTPLGEGVILFDWLGAMGIFTGIIIAILFTRLYVFLSEKGLIIKMPDTVPAVVTNSFASLIPAFGVVIAAAIVEVIFSKTSFGCFHQMIYTILQQPLTHLTGSYPAFLLLTFLSAVFWWFGIQGTMATIGAVLGLCLSMDAANAAAVAAGQAATNIAGWSFYYTFVFANGLLGLNILMLFAKSKRYRTVGRICIFPTACGITESMLFGTPIVYDVWFFVPFVLSQVVPMSLAWLATVLGIIPCTNGVFTAGGTPVILTGALQGGVVMAIAQVVAIALQALIWLPFFRKVDKDAYALEQGETKAE